MKRAIILGSSAAAILAVAYLWPTFGASSVEDGGARGTMCIAGHCCCARTGEGKDCRAMGRKNVLHSIPTSSSVRQSRRTRLRRRIPRCWRNCIAIADVTGCTAIRICSIVIEATTAPSAKSASERL